MGKRIGDAAVAAIKDDEKIVLVFDAVLKKPGCVLLQAAYGCGQHNTFLQMTFENWLLAPTPDMKRFAATKAQWQAIARKFDKK